MAVASFQHNEAAYQKPDFMVRSKVYYGLLRGTLQLGSFLKDEKLKAITSDACCYCNSQSDLTLDHLIPRLKGGKHSADNYVVACRSCNSSKKALDLLEWMAKKGRFPPLGLLRRYLKLVIHYCVENDLMDNVLEQKNGAQRQLSLFDDWEKTIEAPGGNGPGDGLPFTIELVPHVFPAPVDLRGPVGTIKEFRE
jgi:hypothetical protein